MSARGLGTRDIIGAFYDRLESNPGSRWVEGVSMYFPSDQEKETYKWLGMAPAMQEWIGGRQAKGFRENGITIENKEYEATLEVLMREMRRDKTGQIMVRVNEMADRANAHWASLLSTLIINAPNAVCYDGQFFFDTDHSEGKSGTQSNLISTALASIGVPTDQRGTPTNPTAKAFQAAILASIQQMFTFKDDQGEPLNEGATSFLVMVPVPHWAAASSAVSLPQLQAGESNLIVSMQDLNIAVTANPRLPWTDQFVTFRTDGAVKPLIRQDEDGIEMDVLDEDSDYAVLNKKVLFGISASRNVGYGYWQHAVLNRLTAT